MMSASTILKPWQLKGTIVYGPFHTRRCGSSLGINLLPPNVKICNFDCVYCQCGWTRSDFAQLNGYKYPTINMIEQEINSRFSELVGQGIIPEAIVVSGNGEPTLYPQLEEAMDLIHKYRDKFFPRTRTSVLSNGTMLSSDSVVRAINKLDDRSIKLDAGDMDVFRLVDIPLVPFSIEKLVAEIKRLKDCIIQSCFMKGKRSNVTLKSIESWIQAISRIKPKCVHIYSLDRVTPMQGLEVVDKETLLDIAGKLKQATGVEGLVF